MLPDEKIAKLSTSTVCNNNVSSTNKITTANAATTTNITNFNSEDQQSKKSEKKSYLQTKKDVIDPIVEPSLSGDSNQIEKDLTKTSLSSGLLNLFLNLIKVFYFYYLLYDIFRIFFLYCCPFSKYKRYSYSVFFCFNCTEFIVLKRIFCALYFFFSHFNQFSF